MIIKYKNLEELDRRSESSVIWRNCSEKPDGKIQDFKINVIGCYKSDAMLRQIFEAVWIDGTTRENLINNKSE